MATLSPLQQALFDLLPEDGTPIRQGELAERVKSPMGITRLSLGALAGKRDITCVDHKKAAERLWRHVV